MTYEHRWTRGYRPTPVERAHYSERPIWRYGHPDCQAGLTGANDVTVYEGLESVTSRVFHLDGDAFPVNELVANLGMGARLCLGQRCGKTMFPKEPGYYRLFSSNYSAYSGPKPHTSTKVACGITIPEGAAFHWIYRLFGKGTVLFAQVVPSSWGSPDAWPEPGDTNVWPLEALVRRING